MENLPDELLILIFKYFDFKTRLTCSLVCKKWLIVLTSRGRAKLDDVAVLNIFEKSVWKESINIQAKSRLNSVEISDVSQLNSVSDHVDICNSLKIWFRTAEFVDRTLRTLADRNMQMRCLDLYPYGNVLPMQIVKNYYPNLEALILRPHGPDYFWTGMPFSDFPDFPRMDSLVLDSVTLSGQVVSVRNKLKQELSTLFLFKVQFPASLSQLEWSHRDDEAFSNFIDNLPLCVNLKYLLISHVHLEETVLQRLFNCFSALPHLMFVVFKFVKFASVDYCTIETPTPPPLKSIKFDLCYGDIEGIVNLFIRYSSVELQIIQINSIYEEDQINSLYKIIPALNKRNLWLQMGVLQRQATTTIRVAPIRERNANAADHLQDDVDAAAGRSELYPPLEFRDVLCKLDLSFVENDAFVSKLLSCGIYTKLLEARFIQCSALNDNGLSHLSKICVRLRKLYMNDCENVTSSGLEEFVKSWDGRKSKELNIVWRAELKFSDFCRELTKNYQQLNVKCYDKSLPNDVKGQKITIWDNRKMLTIHDYSPNELHWIMGFVVP